MSEFIVDITMENAQQLLIDESMQRPVVIDFWADWCGPCKSLMPILEGLANEYAGAFLLAKVNADDQQQIAAQFGVRSLPTVVVMQNGQPVDGFQGAQSEVQVREVLAKYLPKPWDALLQQAAPLLQEEQWAEALELLRQAYELSSSDIAIGKTLARVYLELNRCAEAEAIIQSIPMAEQDAQYEQLLALLDLKQNAAKSPEVTALEEALAADPENIDLQLQLAIQYSQHQHSEEALELLLSMLRKDINCKEGEVKKTTLDIIAALGKADPLAIKYQRQVFSLLY
ncbi:thioredoxin [uncultured Pseudoteredinibacter sp.]|uniref:thioredoxin n=1 Tax=uncultured Pseudoteredinibacter sp. TaxID=1641701 RepID=UPI00262EACD2|nr:thioredoxin [uncultured Pseudoteredinibacter sp.]